jgi:hypothetical protein
MFMMMANLMMKIIFFVFLFLENFILLRLSFPGNTEIQKMVKQALNNTSLRGKTKSRIDILMIDSKRRM